MIAPAKGQPLGYMNNLRLSVAFDKAILTPSFGSSRITRSADTIDMVAATDNLAKLVER